MFETIYSQAIAVTAVAVLTFVFLKGDEPEKIAGAAYGLSYLGTLVTLSGSLSVPQWGVMGMDILLLMVFLGLAWHSRRAWLVWASAFQAIVVTSHFLVAANLRPPSDAFAAVNNMSNYGLLIAMAVGTFWAWQERRAAAMGSEQTRPPRL